MSGVDPAEITDLLPQRQPCLLLDRVDELAVGDRLVASRAVSADEGWCAGHFPGDPVMPGVLQLEALTQAAALLAARSERGLEQVTLAGLDKVRFRRRVVPGDQLRLQVQLIEARTSLWRLRGRIEVDGERTVDAVLRIALHRPRT